MKRISASGRNNLTFCRYPHGQELAPDLMAPLKASQQYVEEREVPVEGWDDDGHPLVVGLTGLQRAEEFAKQGGWSQWFLDVWPAVVSGLGEVP